MNNIEIYLIKLLFQRNFFQKYSQHLDGAFLKDNTPELHKIFVSITKWFEQFPDRDIANATDLEVYFYSLFPATTKRDREVYSVLFHRLTEIDIDYNVAEQYVQGYVDRVKASKIALAALEVSEGKKPVETLQNAITQVLEASAKLSEEQEFVTDDLGELYEKHYKEAGLRWRLPALNRMLGSIRQGDLGIVFARPETGKTTFLASEVSYMAGQMSADRNVLWFNNEQVGGVVKGYIYRAALGLTSDQLYGSVESNKAKYKELTGMRIKVIDRKPMWKNDIERICRQWNPGLIVFDQIDKIKGFNADRNDLELGAIYQWARELAARYCPVIGVCQAGASAEGKRYLEMDDMDNSKTSKSAEADWILGIGKTHQDGWEQIRHLHLPKNKLVGDNDTDPNLRHGKVDVLIRADIARFEDVK